MENIRIFLSLVSNISTQNPSKSLGGLNQWFLITFKIFFLVLKSKFFLSTKIINKCKTF